MTGDGRPTDVAGWRTALHKASLVQQGDPDYAEAQQVKQEALLRIGDLERQATIADAPQGPGPGASFLAGVGHMLSAGTGEPISGLASAATGGTFREGAQHYREGLANLSDTNPWAEYGGEMTGLVLPAAVAPARAALSPLAGSAVPVGEAVIPGVARRLLAGAGTGATLGGVSGFSAGGEDPGSLEQRVAAGLRGGATGAAVGGLTSYLGSKVQTAGVNTDMARSLEAERIATERAKGRFYDAKATALTKPPEPPPTAPVPDGPPAGPTGGSDLLPSGIRESVARKQLAAQGLPPDKVEEAITRLRGGEPPAAGAAPITTPAPGPSAGGGATAGLPLEPASVAGVPPGLRPGEQATTTTTLENPHENLPPGRGMEVTGNRATPVPPTEPTILEMQEGDPPPAWMAHAQKLGASPEAARQAWLTKTPLDQLPGLSDAQRQGLTDFANKEIAVTKETMGRVQRGAGPSKLAYRQRAFPSPMQSTGAVVRSPIYQHADVIAQRIANDPEIQAQFPAYQGLDQNATRSLLLKQLVANAQAGNPVPALTSIPAFLQRLAR